VPKRHDVQQPAVCPRLSRKEKQDERERQRKEEGLCRASMSTLFSFHSRGITEVTAQGHESYIHERLTCSGGFSLFFLKQKRGSDPKSPR
jgi:hypothetical protein